MKCEHCGKQFQESLLLAMLGDLGASGSAIRGSVECSRSPTEEHEWVDT